MYPMNNIEEAEKFLGIDLPGNTLLEKLPQKLIEQEWSDDSQISGNTIVYLFNGIEGDFVATWVYEKYSYIGNEVWINYQLVTELNPYENGGGLSIEIKDDSSEQEMETYITASGRECSIIYSKHGMWCKGYAYMDIDGILTEVQIDGGTPESVAICIKEIMDAYE